MDPHALRPRPAMAWLRLGTFALLALLTCGATTPPSPRHATPPATRRAARAPARAAPAAPPRAVPAIERGKEARVAEENGLYARAAAELRTLRAGVAPDADLDLALALDEARCGRLDSAAVLLGSPLMDRALADSLPLTRRRLLPWVREGLWVNGRFDGWHWYVARARFEVAYEQRRWDDARRAAQACVAARPLSGADWLALALATARAGDDVQARDAAERAAGLDPALPEAQYVVGLYDWRAGRRAEAQARFRAAVALDSLERGPALALLHVRMPGGAPDSLPATFLRGAREVTMLTSPERPKFEELVQFDTPAHLAQSARVPLDSAWVVRIHATEMLLPVLVDERGRAVAHTLPWLTEDRIPGAAVAALVGSLPGWRFTPAVRGGIPQRAWVILPYRLDQ